MEVLVVEVSGKMAHFRKFYANNTAFSFSIPPRTSIMGMLAALCGRPKDSYYEAFASENLHLGVGLASPIKKSFHRMNYMKVEKPNDFPGLQEHIQTPLELVSGFDLRRDVVQYRFYISQGAMEEPFGEIKQRILERDWVFPLTLGPAFLTAGIEKAQSFEVQTENFSGDGVNTFHSALASQQVESLNLENHNPLAQTKVEEERLPADFKADGDREVRRMSHCLFSVGDNPLRAQLKPGSTYYSFENENGATERFQFL